MPLSEVSIVDVTARDGLQNEPIHLSTDQKVELVVRLIRAGFTRLEVVSFVNASRVPQMADADAVMAALPRVAGVTYAALILNERGVERALAADIDEVNFVIPVTDTFAGRNQGMTTRDAIRKWEAVARALEGTHVRRTVTLAVAFGCPFEGDVPVGRIEDVVRSIDGDVDEISLADTIGVGVPKEVAEKARAVVDLLPHAKLRVHFHNSRNSGLANAWAAYEAGVRIFDATVGGVGGCPFAPGASGNIPAEDLLYLFSRSGVSSPVDLPLLLESVPWMAERLERELPGQLSRAGIFPSQGGDR